MSRALICSVLVVQSVLWVGCHKKSPERSVQSSPAPATSQAVAAPGQATDAPAPPPSLPTLENNAAPVPEAADPDVVRTVANAVQSFTIAHPQGPRNLEDLVSAGYLHNLPAPPPGKKFALNPKNFEVTLVNQ